MRFLAVAVAVAALTAVAVAAAAPGDPKKVIVPSVQAQAKAVNVHRSDLPGTGWTSKPSSSSGSTPRCSYYNPDQSDLTEHGDADSAEFSLPDGSFVSSSTGIFADAGQGRTAYARVVRPALPRCLAELFARGTGNAAQVTTVSSSAIPWPKLGDRTNAYRLVSDFHVSSTQKIRVTIDLVTLNHGKLDTVVFFAGIGTPFPPVLEQAVASRVAARALKIS